MHLIDIGGATALLTVRYAGDTEGVEFKTISVASLHDRLSANHFLGTSETFIDICVDFRSERLQSVEFEMGECGSADADSCKSLGSLNFYCDGVSRQDDYEVTGLLMKDEDDPYAGYETNVGDILRFLNDEVSSGSLSEKSPFRIYANGACMYPTMIRSVTATTGELSKPESAAEQSALNSYLRYNVNSFQLQVEADESFDHEKMLNHVDDMRNRSVFGAMWACPPTAREVLENARHVGTTPVKAGMTVDDLHVFLDVLRNAGMGAVRVACAKTNTPVTKADCHLSCVGGRDSAVIPTTEGRRVSR